MNQLSMRGEYSAVDRDRAGQPEATHAPSGERSPRQAFLMIREASKDRIRLPWLRS